ncbi:hypothetical protein M378DRAFT_198176 [Amanita muscaria Koide BX008]|uniref:HMG box domain-containing protein n=1 Tax=Amanita muscaria (strain Koide BX008) TaxID=946122 RepID=A0A0C2SNY6_AMAMK|nr:hypothetical protein M378DRAFT_198176 [Amanita muscaria Koide BX008]
MFTGRLLSRVSVALLKYSKPAHLARKYVPLSPNGLARSFITSSRVAFAPEQTEIKQEEDNQAPGKKPKKTKNASSSEAKKPHAKKQESPAQNSKVKPVITVDMLPPPPPATAYSRFLKDWYSKRPKSSSPTEIGTQSKDVAAEWHALSESERQPYIEDYRAEREVYVKERQEWFDNIDPVTLKELNKARTHKGKKQIRNPNRFPSDRKPLTPFFLFAAEYRRGQTEKLGVPEAGRRAGEAWRALSDTEKQHFLDRYKNEMDAWRARNGTA